MQVEHVARTRVDILVRALGLDAASFYAFIEWTLSEHLVTVLGKNSVIDDSFFSRPDALKAFRSMLESRTGRVWSREDLEALFDRVKADRADHYRDRIPYEELLKLLWQVPYECAWCHSGPPEVNLHVDHVVPASRGGPSTRANLQLLCAPHNLSKSNRREARLWLNLL